MKTIRALLLMLAFYLSGVAVHAQDHEFVLLAGARNQRLVVTAQEHQAGKTLPIALPRIASWVALNPHGYTNNLRETMAKADGGAVEAKGRVLTGIRGTWVIAASYLPGPDAKEPTRFAKSLLASGPSTPHFDKRAGHRLEMIPETDPFTVEPDEILRVKVLFDGQPLAGAAVNFLADGKSTQLKTDAAGLVELKLAKAGWQWLAVRHSVTPDSASFAATLTFRWPL